MDILPADVFYPRTPRAFPTKTQHSWLTEAEQAALYTTYQEGGTTYQDLALLFHVSRRSVQVFIHEEKQRRGLSTHQPDRRVIQPRHISNRTHCPHGHPYTPENTYTHLSTGAKVCRSCRRKTIAPPSRRE